MVGRNVSIQAPVVRSNAARNRWSWRWPIGGDLDLGELAADVHGVADLGERGDADVGAAKVSFCLLMPTTPACEDLGAMGDERRRGDRCGRQPFVGDRIGWAVPVRRSSRPRRSR